VPDRHPASLALLTEQHVQSIKTQLRFSHALDVGTPHKPVMEVPDLFAFLHFLWNDDPHRFSHERERVQFSLFLLLCAYTSSRPGALVESSADGIRGSGDALRYRDVKLTLIRNPVAGEKDVLVLEITLLLMKGKRHMKEPYVLRRAGADIVGCELTIDSTTYVLHEQDDNLALCPVLHFLALAFSDNAFKAPDLDCPEAIYQMKVPEPRQAIELEWDGEILNKCIFRRAEKGVSGMKISDRVLPYYSISKHFRKAGQDAGFRENLTPYAIRRATGNAVNSIYHHRGLFFGRVC